MADTASGGAKLETDAHVFQVCVGACETWPAAGYGTTFLEVSLRSFKKKGVRVASSHIMMGAQQLSMYSRIVFLQLPNPREAHRIPSGTEHSRNLTQDAQTRSSSGATLVHAGIEKLVSGL